MVATTVAPPDEPTCPPTTNLYITIIGLALLSALLLFVMIAMVIKHNRKEEESDSGCVIS